MAGLMVLHLVVLRVVHLAENLEHRKAVQKAGPMEVTRVDLKVAQKEW